MVRPPFRTLTNQRAALGSGRSFLVDEGPSTMPRHTRGRLLPAAITTAAAFWISAFGCCLFVDGRAGARVHSALLALAVTASVTVCVILAMRTILARLTAHIDAHIADMGRTVDEHCRDLGASMRLIVWADHEDRRRRDEAREWSG